jgi:hypothetical protein
LLVSAAIANEMSVGDELAGAALMSKGYKTEGDITKLSI